MASDRINLQKNAIEIESNDKMILLIHRRIGSGETLHERKLNYNYRFSY